MKKNETGKPDTFNFFLKYQGRSCVLYTQKNKIISYRNKHIYEKVECCERVSENDRSCLFISYHVRVSG